MMHGQKNIKLKVCWYVIGHGLTPFLVDFLRFALIKNIYLKLKSKYEYI